MTNKKKQKAKALSERSGMSHAAAVNQLNKSKGPEALTLPLIDGLTGQVITQSPLRVSPRPPFKFARKTDPDSVKEMDAELQNQAPCEGPLPPPPSWDLGLFEALQNLNEWDYPLSRPLSDYTKPLNTGDLEQTLLDVPFVTSIPRTRDPTLNDFSSRIVGARSPKPSENIRGPLLITPLFRDVMWGALEDRVTWGARLSRISDVEEGDITSFTQYLFRVRKQHNRLLILTSEGMSPYGKVQYLALKGVHSRQQAYPTGEKGDLPRWLRSLLSNPNWPFDYLV